MPLPPRAKKWLLRLGLVLGGVVAGLALAEAVGRFDGLVQGNDLVFMAPMSYPLDIYVQDGQLNYPNPKFTGTIQSFGYAVTPRFTSWGTRGEDPKKGVRTWITVGDSFDIALQVNDDQTFSARLAQAEGIQVINAGVDGYSTWKEALRAIQIGRNFPAERVVVAFFTGNDFFDNKQPSPQSLDPSPGPGEPGAPEYRIPQAGARFQAPWITTFAHNHSVLFAHWWSWQETQRVRSGQDPNARRFRDELALFTTEGIRGPGNDPQHTVEAMQFMAKALEKIGAKGLVAVIPPAFVMSRETAILTYKSVALDNAEPDLDTAQKEAVESAQKAGLPVCDLMPALRKAHEAGERPYLPFDGHLTVEGHQVVADAIRACIAGGA